MKLVRQLVILLAIVLGVKLVFPLIEGAATSPGTLDQLITSRHYFTGGWVRPVRQRGMYFGRPDLPGAWHR
jgi:hypothetical protein